MFVIRSFATSTRPPCGTVFLIRPYSEYCIRFLTKGSYQIHILAGKRKELTEACSSLKAISEKSVATIQNGHLL